VLVNNAGVYEFSPIEAVTAEHFHKQFNINVLGLILATQKAVGLFDEKGGSVINISSAVSQNPFPNASVYSATKAAVDAVTKSLSKELGARNIRVNSLLPGMTETEGVHTAGFLESDFHAQILTSTPLGRIGQPNDIAKVALFLASDDSAWL
ncbi:MAG: SDR family NAD(P)-dependent oxidoreductase, partial [Nostoc sp.]